MSDQKAKKHFELLRSAGARNHKIKTIIAGLAFLIFTFWFLLESGIITISMPSLHYSEWQSDTASGMSVVQPEKTFESQEAGVIKTCLDRILFIQEQTPESQEADAFITRLVRTLLMYVLTGVGIIIVRFLYESTDGNFFSSIISVLAAAVLSSGVLSLVIDYFITRGYGSVWERVLFSLSLLTFGFTLYYVIGFYPMSTRILLKSMRRKLLFSESADIDWVKEGTYYPVDIVEIDSIPQDTEHIHGAHVGDMYKKLYDFVKSTSASITRNRLILIGGFGAGKSTALLETVQKKMNDPFHNGNVPVYVKLRDWIKNNELDDIMKAGAAVLQGDNQIKYMEILFSQITAEAKTNKATDVMKDVFAQLHEGRRLVYVYDGVNELLQRQSNVGNNKDYQQYVRNLMSFLYHFAGGNPCVLSMCDLPNVITTKRIMLGDLEQYLVYAVKGVHIDEARFDFLQKNKWMKKLVPHVALYRLAESSVGEKGPRTIYDLLETYVTNQLRDELIDKKEEEYKNAIRKTIEYNINKNAEDRKSEKNQQEKNNLGFLGTPYVGLSVIETDQKYFELLSNTQLLYTETVKKSGTEEVLYHPKHILIFEYILADYVIWKIKEKDKKFSFVDFFCEKSNSGEPGFLAFPHLRNVFRMVIERMIKEDELGNRCKNNCMEIFNRKLIESCF